MRLAAVAQWHMTLFAVELHPGRGWGLWCLVRATTGLREGLLAGFQGTQPLSEPLDQSEGQG